MVAAFASAIGWQMWELHLYNNAIREAKEAGFTWAYTDSLTLIRQDWRNALNKETWGAHRRDLGMGKVPDLGRYNDMLHRLRPTVLSVRGCNSIEVLKDLHSLQWLELDSAALQNVDCIKNLTGMQSLWLSNCHALQSLDGLKSLSGLQHLWLDGCRSLQSVDFLKYLTGLKLLRVEDCTMLQNLDVLKGIRGLQGLCLRGCTALQNVDALKGLPTLLDLDLRACHEIPAIALRELRAALPNTNITFPDGTKNPPQ